MQKLISNHNQNYLLKDDLELKSQFKNMISNRDFKSFDFKSVSYTHLTLPTNREV